MDTLARSGGWPAVLACLVSVSAAAAPPAAPPAGSAGPSPSQSAELRLRVAAAQSRPRLLVLDLRAAVGVDAELARLLGDMVATRLHAIGRHEVLSSSDLASMLDIETQKQLLGCSDDACLVEIGGALDAGYLVAGSLSRLGGRDMVTLKLLDARKSRLSNQLTEELPADESDYDEAIRVATYSLLSLEAPPPETLWYENPWLWVAVGVVVAGATTAAILLSQPETAPAASLGQVVLDAR